MRSLNVILEKPSDVTINKNMFLHKYFKMLSLKLDPSYGLYKVKLFKLINESIIDICDTSLCNIDTEQCTISSKPTDFFSITEIRVCI